MVFEPEPGGASVLPSKSSVARTQTFHIEVVRRRGEDATGGDLVKAAHQLGITGVTACQATRPTTRPTPTARRAGSPDCATRPATSWG